LPKHHPRAHRTARRSRRRSPAYGCRLSLAAALAGCWIGLGIDAAAQDPCVGFLERPVEAEGLSGAEAVFATDLDGDGDIDVVSASHNDNKITWYDNDCRSRPSCIAGQTAPSFRERTIATDAVDASSVFAADLDGDGDKDVLSASRDDTIAWYDNDGSTPPGFRRRVVSSEVSVPLAVFAADVDGDQDLDVLSASFGDNKIAWFENLHGEGGGEELSSVFVEHVVTVTALGAAAVFAADLDGDGDTDLLSASRLDGRISWYEQRPAVDGTDGAAAIAFDEHVLTTTAELANSVHAGDLDGDGDLDVVAAASGTDSILWFENGCDTPPSCSTRPEFTERLVSDTAITVRAVFAADLDGDGDDDVVAASSGDDTVAWYEHEGGTPPTFARNLISADTVSADGVHVADVDGDTHLDVVSISARNGTTQTQDKVAWFENDGAADPSLATEHVIATTASGALSVTTADLDMDGAAEVLAARSGTPLVWFDNPVPATPTFVANEIAASAPNATFVRAFDPDGDLDVDVLAAYREDDTIAWYENDGQTPPGFSEHVISTAADSVERLFAADVDMDGHLDVLSASSEDDSIALYEYDATSPSSFGAEQLLSTEADGARDVSAADLDGDGDTDVVSASTADHKLVWYENDGTTPDTFPEHRVTTGDTFRIQTVITADIDDDGAADLVTTATGGTVAWWDNLGGSGEDLLFGQRVIGILAGIKEALAIDLDQDGDMDIVTMTSTSTRVTWFENNGAEVPVFSAHIVPGAAVSGTSVGVADLDIDGDLDLAVGYESEIAWYEQLDEICQGFDTSGDGVIDGVELAWLSRAFGSVSDDPGAQWWAGIDLDQDGAVDGDDLAILTSVGVWGQTTETCTFACR